MENVLESAFFQNELRYYGLSGDDARLIRSKEGVSVARVCIGESSAMWMMGFGSLTRSAPRLGKRSRR
jgi:hypothetical protein